jgi:hypothetical protein
MRSSFTPICLFFTLVACGSESTPGDGTGGTAGSSGGGAGAGSGGTVAGSSGTTSTGGGAGVSGGSTGGVGGAAGSSGGNGAGMSGSGSGGVAGTTGGSAGGGAAGSSSGAAGSAAGDAGASGSSGASGASGASGGGGAGGSGSGSCGAAGITFCTDFEGAAIPTELVYWPEYQRANVANFMTLDPTGGFNSTQGLKVNGTEFSQMFGVATPGATFWGRVRLRSDTDIQMGHNTYVLATDVPGDPNAGEAIRIGEHQCQLELNRKSDDAEKLSNGGTYSCEGGVKFVANSWYCLEFFYDGANSEVRVFVDDAEVEELHVTDWGPYTYQTFKFGFEKYHGANKTLWYDDVALGTARVGCGS